MLRIQEIEQRTNDEARNGYGDPQQSVFNCAWDGFDFVNLEFFPSSDDQMFGHSGVGSRGISWADDLPQVHSADFARVDAPRMVATGSWGSPSKDLSPISGDNGHAVSSFNIFDQIPSDRVFLDGVRNGYAFIENRNFGFVNNQVNDATKKSGPYKGHNAAGKIATEPILNIHPGNQYQNNGGADGAGFGPENFGVTHTSILSQQRAEGGFSV